MEENPVLVLPRVRTSNTHTHDERRDFSNRSFCVDASKGGCNKRKCFFPRDFLGRAYEVIRPLLLLLLLAEAAQTYYASAHPRCARAFAFASFDLMQYTV